MLLSHIILFAPCAPGAAAAVAFVTALKLKTDAYRLIMFTARPAGARVSVIGELPAFGSAWECPHGCVQQECTPACKPCQP